MLNLTKLEFTALDIFENNFLSWIFDDEIHLEAMNFRETIKEENNVQTMIFIRHHLHEGLKIEYLTIKDPLVPWQNLKEKYDHQKFTILPQALYD
jgi:ferritin